MDFRLSEEQQQFSESLQRWIERDYSFEARKKIIYSDTGISDQGFNALGELGAPVAPTGPEHHQERSVFGGRPPQPGIVSFDIFDRIALVWHRGREPHHPRGG